MTLLPTNPVPAAELAVIYCPMDMTTAELRAACVTVALHSRDSRALACARRVAEQIDLGRMV